MRRPRGTGAGTQFNPGCEANMSTLSLLSRGLFALSAYVCMPAILALIGTDVVRRYLFNVPIVWSQEAATLALFLVIVLALPESWRRNVHIKADFLNAVMRPWLNALLARLTWLILTVVSALIVVQCWNDIDLMTLFNERTVDLDLPLTWFRAVLGGVAFLCALIALWRLFSRRPEGDDSEVDAS